MEDWRRSFNTFIFPHLSRRPPCFSTCFFKAIFGGDETGFDLTQLNGFHIISGRVLFASVFILSAYQEFNEFGLDGGPAAKAIAPKFNKFASHVKKHAGFEIPEVEMKIILAASVAFKGVGSVMFIIGSSVGAYLLALHQVIVTPILFDFYNYEHDEKEFIQLFIKFTQHMALFGALLFFIGMKNSFPARQLKKKTLKTKTN